MKAYPLTLEGVKLITVDQYKDSRGYFSDHWHEDKFKNTIGDYVFKQDSYVASCEGVIRGLHYQLPPYEQGKLIRCLYGSIQDVVVDLRKTSSTFGKWLQIHLNSTNQNQNMLWIPPGFAHGYCVLGDRADVLYKMTQIHNPKHERTLLWNDKNLNIPWKQIKNPILSTKDKNGTPLKDADVFS